MAQNPKYDNDMVNLGYLNKRLGQTEESINKNNSSISQLPKNYSTPPNPPYYKDSLLCYGNKIYRCNKTKMNGTFSWNDWTIVATDDTAISDFINNTYEVEKLEIQEQIDGKIQTHYQDNDPSKDWTTDLEKGRHVGDYWYNTSDNTQWRYNQITTGPTITYGWGQVNIPKSVFDTIDRKKSIYTTKPTSYKKDDLWIIEETLSDDDLPIGTDENPIAKGDWVFSIADSEVYNKEHWVKRDEDVSLSYLEQHYYTITEIDSNLEVIERNTESKITKATEEISLNVSQTYTTKEEHTKAINDFDKQIGTINNTIIKHKETLSDLSLEVGEVSASVESVETKTEELTVDLNGVKKNIIPMSASANSSIYIEDASDNPLIELEIEGKSTQETRSGKNLFNYIDNLNTSIKGLTSVINKDGSITTTGIPTSNYVWLTQQVNINDLLEDGQTYTISQKYANNNLYIQVQGTSINGGSNTYISLNSPTLNSKSFTVDKSKYTYGIQIQSNTMELWGNESLTSTNYYQLEKGSVATEFEQYGASPSPNYPSEIKSVGYENLFPIFKPETRYGVTLTINDDGTFNLKGRSTNTNSSGSKFVVDIPYSENKIISGKTYTASSNVIMTENMFVSIEHYNGETWVANDFVFSSNKISHTAPITAVANADRYRLSIRVAGGTTVDLSNINLQLEVGDTVHPYIPYDKYGIEFNITNKIDTRTLLIVLNEPLRSLPNGVKDIAYVQNGVLYVERKTGHKQITSDMLTSTHNALTNSKEIRTNKSSIDNLSLSSRSFLSNTFRYNTAGTWGYDTIGIFSNAGNSNEAIAFRIPVDADATYFNQHPTYINYELAEPYTEEIGEIKMPNTFEGINYITITDELKPTINLTYATNTLITNYVEKHVAELKVSDEEIRSYVSSVDSFATTLGSTIDGKLQDISKTFNSYVPTSDFVTLEKSVNQLQTDTYTKTEINTKLTDGSVTKVSTVSGTFDENGMHYEKTNAPTSSTINERGVEVDSTTTGEELLFAGYDEELNQTIVRTENLTVRKYFIVGDNSRIENYGNGGGIFII